MTDKICVHSHVGLMRVQRDQENIPIPNMKGQCAMLRHIPQALEQSCTLANGAHTASTTQQQISCVVGHTQ